MKQNRQPNREEESAASLHVEVVPTIHAVDPTVWNALCGADNPFVEHGFLAALEDGGCVGPQTGWLPQFLVVRPEPGAPAIGAAPLYLKGDSYGEYIFDWGWANAAMRAGIRYYPKLVTAVPFTPATGPRMLVHPDADRAPVVRALAHAGLVLAERLQASGVHWLFCSEHESDELAASGYTPRRTRQFHWRNNGFGCFDDYLASLTRKRRKEVRRERNKANSHGLDIRVIRGPQLTEAQWRGLYCFYERTVRIHGQIQYLTERFFQLIADRFADRVVAVICERDGRPVAGNINFTKGGHLYGRYWGCETELDGLHFEACYYRLIDWAIANGIQLFEAGAQGHHKLARGFLPSVTHSAHAISHPGLRDAIDRFIRHEASETEAECDWLMGHSPYAEDRSPSDS